MTNSIPPDASADDLEAQAQPLPGRDPSMVALGEIPLPPGDLVDELDNQKPAAAPSDGKAQEIATLDFCGDEMPYAAIPLKYPFRWEGVRYDAITVRQLSTAEVGTLLREFTAKGSQPELFDLYGAMCGLPAKVLQALPATDGDKVTEKGWDFLPPSFRPATD